MKVLLACEESQTVCMAFRSRGHEAYSCDAQECSGGHPEWHLQQDVLQIIKSWRGRVISFPPCTDLSVSGARYFAKKRADGSQYKSIKFFLDVWKYSDCTENPIGIMNTPMYLKRWFHDLYDYAISIGFTFNKPQIIQPWQFGHPESKKTCLWLKGLPKLEPTNILPHPKCGYWSNQTPSGQNKLGPSPERAKLRSKTYQGIADAMAAQWGIV